MDHKLNGDPLQDLACDILGPFFASRYNRPFYIVFDHFHRCGGERFLQLDDQWLWDNFRRLLLGFVSQELSRIREQTSHQTELLKRRIKECLNSEVYETADSGHGQRLVYLVESKKSLRLDCPPIPFERLLEIVRSEAMTSTSRQEWCHAIFNAVAILGEYQNGIYLHYLLATTVTVNAEMVELEGFKPTRLPDPETDLIDKELASLCDQAVKHVSSSVVKRFVEQERLTNEIAVKLTVACRTYLEDYCNSHGAEKLPVYFREVLPDIPHSLYLSHYKYMFDAIIAAAVRYLRENQRVVSIGDADRDYI